MHPSMHHFQICDTESLTQSSGPQASGGEVLTEFLAQSEAIHIGIIYGFIVTAHAIGLGPGGSHVWHLPYVAFSHESRVAEL